MTTTISARAAAILRRAVADLRCGDPVLLCEEAACYLVFSAEAVDEERLLLGRRLGDGNGLVVVTAERARSLGLSVLHGPAALALPHDAASVNALADPTLAPVPSAALASGDGRVLLAAAIDLMKRARLLPSALVFPVAAARVPALAEELGLIRLDAALVASAVEPPSGRLRQVVEARLPLADAADAQIVAFRPADGGIEHLAVVVGTPDTARPVLVRIHSECFTGDLLGSLRCDCGEQLRGAIRAIAASGEGGVVLYLAQEGRGIGLVNKLRAYRLQDEGRDTIDANEELGFEADERVYQPAADMLRQLGIARVRLMTNNPAKVAALARLGIEVTERVPHVIAPNEENRAYLATKASRGGHIFS